MPTIIKRPPSHDVHSPHVRAQQPSEFVMDHPCTSHVRDFNFVACAISITTQASLLTSCCMIQTINSKHCQRNEWRLWIGGDTAEKLTAFFMWRRLLVDHWLWLLCHCRHIYMLCVYRCAWVFVCICFILVWFGLVWFGLVWFGLVWFVSFSPSIYDEQTNFLCYNVKLVLKAI